MTEGLQSHILGSGGLGSWMEKAETQHVDHIQQSREAGLRVYALQLNKVVGPVDLSGVVSVGEKSSCHKQPGERAMLDIFCTHC